MRKICLALMLSVLPLSAIAANAPAAAKPEVKKKDASQTAHQFEDLLVQGKYHFSDETVTTVEEDKVLDSLIGVRSDFKDRLKKSTSRQ